MRKSRFTEVQIIGMIKGQEAGLPATELCRKHGISPASFLHAESQVWRHGSFGCPAPEEH
jgi:hypothetical protein